MSRQVDSHASERKLNYFFRTRRRELAKEIAKSQKPSARWFRYLLWSSIAVAIAGYAYEVIAPVIEGNFSRESLLQFATTAYMLAGGVPLFIFCEATSTKHLTGLKKAGAELLLLGGALVFIASAFALRGEHYFVAVIVGLLSLAIVRFARTYAKSNA